MDKRGDVIDLHTLGADATPSYPSPRGIELREIPDRRRDDVLRQLVRLGNLMSKRLQDYAEELERVAGNDRYGAKERSLVAAWREQLATMRERGRPGIGYCEGLCGGLHSHELVDGLCPQCRRDPRIQEVRP